jgi:hypothetical protein
MTSNYWHHFCIRNLWVYRLHPHSATTGGSQILLFLFSCRIFQELIGLIDDYSNRIRKRQRPWKCSYYDLFTKHIDSNGIELVRLDDQTFWSSLEPSKQRKEYVGHTKLVLD